MGNLLSIISLGRLPQWARQDGLKHLGKGITISGAGGTRVDTFSILLFPDDGEPAAVRHIVYFSDPCTVCCVD